MFNEYSLYYARILDITTICELRSWDVKGHREIILFLYRYWNCCYIGDVEDALNIAVDFNKQFVEPLDDNEVIKSTKSAEKCYLSKDKQYKYKNSTLIEILDITEEEQKKLKSIIGTREKNERKKAANKIKRRNGNGFTKREQAKQDKIEMVKELYKQGMKQKDIAEKIGITKSTVSKYIKL